MKKLTAKVAKNLSEIHEANKYITSFQEVVHKIELHAKMGFTNCFIDSSDSDLLVLKKELEQRGFRCHIEQTGFEQPNHNPKYLTVEW